MLWIITAIVVAALTLRFAMRAIGVRDDIPLPGLVYSLTAPIVQPFYRFFPLDARFDYHAIEVASLAAAGAALALALGLYVLGLLLFSRAPGPEEEEK